jgi:hypothetical protein
MTGVLNEATNTIHKHETGTADLQASCGATSHVPHDNLRIVVRIQPALETTEASKCGRCFDNGGGY